MSYRVAKKWRNQLLVTPSGPVIRPARKRQVKLRRGMKQWLLRSGYIVEDDDKKKRRSGRKKAEVTEADLKPETEANADTDEAETVETEPNQVQARAAVVETDKKEKSPRRKRKQNPRVR